MAVQREDWVRWAGAARRVLAATGFAVVGVGAVAGDLIRDERVRISLADAGRRAVAASAQAGRALGDGFRQLAERGEQVFADRGGRTPPRPVPPRAEEVAGDLLTGPVYAEMTVEQLREAAREAGVQGRSHMKKLELIAALEAGNGHAVTSGV